MPFTPIVLLALGILLPAPARAHGGGWAGRDRGPAVPAADRALESGDVAALTHLLVERTRAGILARFERARAAGEFAAGDVGAGREYVRAYVEFVHYVEGIHDAATRPGERHHAGGAEASHEAR